MGFLQIVDGQFGVVLESFQAFVAQEFLDVVKVGVTGISSVVQLRRKLWGVTFTCSPLALLCRWTNRRKVW